MTNDTHGLESQGLYRIPEAARLLGTTLTSANGHAVLPNKLRYWIRTSTVPARPISPFARHRLISFRDLVSLRLVAVLRSRDVALRDIRETEEWLRKNLDIDWPFISRPLWTYASDVYTEFESHLVVASELASAQWTSYDSGSQASILICLSMRMTLYRLGCPTRTLRLTQEFKSVSPALATPESLAEPFGAN